MKTTVTLLSLMFALQSCSLTHHKSQEVLEPPALDEDYDLYKTYGENALEGFYPDIENEPEEVSEVSENLDKDADINLLEAFAIGVVVGVMVYLLCELEAEAYQDPTSNPNEMTMPNHNYRGCFVFDF
jgi:hypothetical protein